MSLSLVLNVWMKEKYKIKSLPGVVGVVGVEMRQTRLTF